MKNTKLEHYFKGLKDGISVGIAYIPFGITLGLISKGFGMNTLLSGLMSFGIYAGSAESLFLKAIYEQKMLFIEVIISVFMINLRYMLLNLIVFKEIDKNTTILEKILVGIGLTDETATYVTLKKAKNAWYIIGVNTIPYLSFSGMTVVGSVFGSLIPEMFRNSLTFVLYAAFLSLLVVALKEKIKYIEVVIYVIILKLMFIFLPTLNKMSTGWSMILIMILSSLFYAIIHKNDNNEAKKGGNINE